jgi:signal transduction histidine kinase/CheY-like chemotaxis protein
VFACSIQAAEPGAEAATIAVMNGRDSIQVTPLFRYWQPGREVTIDEVQEADRQKQFLALPTTRIADVNGGNWYRLEVQFTPDAQQQFAVLEFSSLLIQRLTVYMPTRNGQWQRIDNGLAVPLMQRPIQDRSYAFPLAPSATPYTLYIYAEALPGLISRIDANLHCYNCFHTQSQTYTSIIFLLLGGLLLLCFMVAAVIREFVSKVELLIILGGLGFGGLSVLLYDGFLSGWYPDATSLWIELIRHFPFFNSIMTLLFCRVLFDMAITMPRINRCNNLLIGLMLVLSLVTLLLPGNTLPRIWFNLPLALPTLQILLVALYAMFLRLPGGIYGGIGIASTVLMRATNLLSVTGAVSYDVDVRVIQYVGNLMIGAMLAIAVLNKLNLALRNFRELELNNAVLNAQSQTRMRFLSTMSHEIRTPINGVLGMVQLLEDTPLNAIQKNYLNILQDSGKTLLTVINDILDLGKLDAGKIEFERIPFRIDNFLATTIALYLPLIREKNLDIQFDIDPEMPLFVCGDPHRLRQVIGNLLNNAIKFTEQGSITLRATYTESPNASFCIAVIDTGIGIPLDIQKQLFVEYQQADASTAREFGGTGLGLFICKRIVELMQGKITLVSEQGKGSCFEIIVPLQIDKQAEHDFIRRMSTLKGKANLLITDSVLATKIYDMALKKWGVSCDVVDPEAEKTLFLTRPYDFVSISLRVDHDILHYWQTCCREKNIPLLVLTSPFFHQEKSSIQDLPGVFPLYMPCGYSDLGNAIVDALENRNPVIAVEEKWQTKVRVLVAEDNPVNTKVLEAFLQKYDLPATFVGNGAEAVELYQQQPNAFDVILMDCEMPVMNGFLATEKIRHWEVSQQCQPVTILALTANALDEARQRCLRSGMSDVLTKPIQFEELLNKIKTIGSSSRD